MNVRATIAGLALLGLSCSDDGARADADGGPGGLVTSLGGSVSADDAATGDKLDIAPGMATEDQAETNQEQICEHVDVVLAVDNSTSMQEELEALRGPVFDSFPEALLAVGNGLLDFRIAVIDACNMPAAYHDRGESGDCAFSTGSNYMVSSSPALAQEYACVTELTNDGYQGMPDQCTGDNDDEQPANAAADALADLAGLNPGFLRDDAVLLVVAITDEDEKPVPAIPAEEIASKMIAAKGSVNNMVFVGIGGESLCAGAYGTAIPATTLQGVASVFEGAGRGMFWDICTGSLEEAFMSAIQLVDSACIEFNPEP